MNKPSEARGKPFVVWCPGQLRPLKAGSSDHISESRSVISTPTCDFFSMFIHVYTSYVTSLSHTPEIPVPSQREACLADGLSQKALGICNHLHLKCIRMDLYTWPSQSVTNMADWDRALYSSDVICGSHAIWVPPCQWICHFRIVGPDRICYLHIPSFHHFDWLASKKLVEMSMLARKHQ